MPIGLHEEHLDLARSIADWAASLDPVGTIRSAEDDPSDAAFEKVLAAADEAGLTAIAVPEPDGGGGSVLDQAVALEAAAYALVPGPLLSTVLANTVRGSGGPASGLRLPGADVVWGLAGDAPLADPDLSRRAGNGSAVSVDDDSARRLLVTFAAAEASGVARWCLDTATAYAKVREQFGKPIGSFQALKHLLAEMLETSECVTAAAWDAARAAGEDDAQAAFAVAVAGEICFDGAVEVAKGCVQVLGGIGFTFEHDAHLYLRRAISLRAMVGRDWATSVADLAGSGVRRRAAVDLGAQGSAVREAVRADVARVADADADDRRSALVDTGLLVPHWPAPYGRGADAVEQLVVDEELAAAGIERPNIAIGAWAVPTILAAGTPEQQERFVPPTLRGELTWCQLFSEPGAGSDLASLKTRAVRVDGGWRVTGQKVWTSLAHEADWAILLARTDPDAPQHRGISYFLLDMRSAGIDIRPLREMTGDALFNEVFLDDVLVPDDCLVGHENDGWKLARGTLANERVAMAGTLGHAVEQAIDLLPSASSVDRSLVGHEVAVATVVSQLATRTVLRSLAGEAPGAESSVAKLVGVRSRQDAAELVVELLGERVLLGDDTARAAVHEQLLTRCLSIAGGTTQVLRNVAAERILGLPRG